jgi:hypothetical protein
VSSSGTRPLRTTCRCPAERSIHCRSVGEQESQTSRSRKSAAGKRCSDRQPTVETTAVPALTTSWPAPSTFMTHLLSHPEVTQRASRRRPAARSLRVSRCRRRRPCLSPVARPAAPSVVGPPRPIGSEPWFAAVAGVADLLAGGPIRRALQAHLAVARVAEQPPASTPTSLPERTRRRRPASVAALGLRRCCSSSFGEANAPVVSVAIRMYGSHTSGVSMLQSAALSSGTSANVTRRSAATPRGRSPARPFRQRPRRLPTRRGLTAELAPPR